MNAERGVTGSATFCYVEIVNLMWEISAWNRNIVERLKSRSIGRKGGRVVGGVRGWEKSKVGIELYEREEYYASAPRLSFSITRRESILKGVSK